MYRLTKQGSYILDRVVSSIHYVYNDGKEFFMNVRSNCCIPVMYEIRGIDNQPHKYHCYPGRQTGLLPMTVMGGEGVTVSILTDNKKASIIVCLSKDHEHSASSSETHEHSSASSNEDLLLG